jgi:hypothetical protein
LAGEVSAPAATPASDAQILDFETVEFGTLGARAQDKGQDTVSFAALEDYAPDETFADQPATSSEVLDATVIGAPDEAGSFDAPTRAERKKGLFGRSSKGDKGSRGGRKDRAARKEAQDPSEWLGLDSDFDARKEGENIGSWDNFDEAGDDADGFSWKGGRAGGDSIEDSDYAANEASRIRRKVAENLDLNLSEKEIWYVATGAHFADCRGMRTFLSDNSEHVRGAMIINLASVGSGDLYWTTKERFGTVHPTSARLTSLARRVSRATEIRIKALRTRKPTTEAACALATGRKAVSVVRLTQRGVPFAWSSSQDVATRLDPEKIDEAATFVRELIREA